MIEPIPHPDFSTRDTRAIINKINEIVDILNAEQAPTDPPKKKGTK